MIVQEFWSMEIWPATTLACGVAGLFANIMLHDKCKKVFYKHAIKVLVSCF